MPIAKEEKKKIIKKFGKDEYDTGSATVQIALLTHRILELTEHLKLHKKDKHTRRGLVQLVSQRKKFMKYLIRIDAEAYIKIVKQLSLRG
jgi:small subunit ribosomal protein S15